MPDKPVLIEVGYGELMDKITILQIKSERLEDEQKLANVKVELEALEQARSAYGKVPEQVAELTAELKESNERLWEIEDRIRECERRRDFGRQFVELARSVYMTNDLRAALKREINEATGSQIVEEKSYAKY